MAAGIADLKEKTGVILEAKNIVNMNFLGIRLGENPTISTSVIQSNPEVYLPLLVIPILAALTTYLASRTTQSTSGSQTGGMGKGMMYLFPAMTLLFTFSLPAGLGLYWIVGNIIQIIQQKLINKNIYKKEEEAHQISEAEKQKEAEERQKLIEQREFDKDLLKKSNVSKKKMKNLIEREKSQKSEKDVK
jgi:YidC/Oxa1 family membrane protein insertase